MERNMKLKAAIFKFGVSQRKLARKARVPESYLSQAINGRYILDERQRRRIASALGVNDPSILGL